MNENKKTIKFISFLLIISILTPTILFSNPKKVRAFWWSTVSTDVSTGITAGATGTGAASTIVNTGTNISNLGLKIKNVAIEVGKQILKAVAKRALQEMTKATINWINSGFHGQPLFLENPDSFFEDIAKSEVKNMVDMFGYDSLKYPFGKDFALNAINSYKRQLEDNTAYSLSKVIQDPVLLRNYQNDFNVGGWNGFLINTQYPQNNYLGFQMVATEELARKVQGTGQNAAQKVQGLLEQGQGFLSPETCADEGGDNEYNKTAGNPWNKPSFPEAQWRKDHPYNETNRDAWTRDLAKARAEWAKNNTCENLVTTTPGSVVSSQIMNALGSGQRQGELSAAMGNSLSAIFDALLSKFLTDGLNSLASKSNPENEEDTWSYDGQTLGSPTDGGINSTWDTGPEEPIYIDKFKKDIENGITFTEAELQLISQISDNLSNIWPQARTLDMCLPGPSVGWEERLEEEKTRGDNRIQKAASGASDEKIDEVDKTRKELKFAVSFFKDWIINKMMEELPSSILFIDAVKEIKELSQQSNELLDAKRIKTQGLARLKTIESTLNEIIELDDEGNFIQPETGSFEEQILIQLKKQYDANRVSISNSITVDNRQNELLVTEEQLLNLTTLTAKCEEERTENGWPEINATEFKAEQAVFCDLPIIGGYTHEMFRGTSLTHPELPMVNAAKILKYKVTTLGSMLSFSKKTVWVSIKLSCNSIYNATILDYKGNLPGPTKITETYIPQGPDLGGSGPGVGICEFEGVDEVVVEEEVPQDYCEENGGTFTPNEMIQDEGGF